MTSQKSKRAAVTAAVFPWILAVAGLGFGAAMWFREPSQPSSGSGATSEPNEVRALKTALASAEATSEALRRELDRLRMAQGSATGSTGAAGELAALGDTAKAPTTEQQDLGKRLKDALAGMETHNAASRAEAAKTVWALLQSGPGAGSVLRDAYFSTNDAIGKSLVIASMAFANTPEAKALVIDQVQTEKDPVLRQVLIKQAAKYATQDATGTLQSTFVESVNSTDDPQTRIAAIQGLRYASGGDAPKALMNAATDPSEDVRIAAMKVLVERQAQDPALQELIANDPSPRVREFARCEQVVTDALAPRPRRRHAR